MKEKFIKVLIFTSGFITILLFVVIIAYILINGIPVISFEFLFANTLDSGREGGILPMILSSIYILILTAIFSIPIGVGIAIYMTQYCKNILLIKFIRFISQCLASIPSIIYGLFGFTFIVLFLRLGWSIFSASLVLSLMAIPTIFQVSEVTLNNIPLNLIESSLGLGATRLQTIISVIIPIAIPGITTGIILALTRAFSEAAAVMYVVGSTFQIPLSIFDTGRPLPLHLYILASEGISFENAYGTATVLIFIVLIITISTNYFVNSYQRRIKYEIKS